MVTYYLDIETTGLDEVEDKITTIQYVELERGTGKQLGELTILKEWELGEEGILRKFMEDSPISNKYDFGFIPVGYNLGFEHKFFLEKSNAFNKSSLLENEKLTLSVPTDLDETTTPSSVKSFSKLFPTSANLPKTTFSLSRKRNKILGRL